MWGASLRDDARDESPPRAAEASPRAEQLRSERYVAFELAEHGYGVCAPGPAANEFAAQAATARRSPAAHGAAPVRFLRDYVSLQDPEIARPS